MKIVFLGDLFTGGQLVEQDFHQKIIEVDELVNADLRVCNLEQANSQYATLINNKSTIYSPFKGLSFLKNNKIDIVCMANNHIQDAGESCFLEGLDYLNEMGIKQIGAGVNVSHAQYAMPVSDNLVLLAYCDYGKSYLKKVQIATEDRFGVNPLSYDKIINDLKQIPANCQAVLLLHWGRENVWFPPYDNIALAKMLLKHPQVHSIIGTHPHRIQGRLTYNNKIAYMSLGNFLFPNFYYNYRTQIIYPERVKKTKSTREYHPVFSTTLKKWRYSNRVSLVLILDNGLYVEKMIKQEDNVPGISCITGIEKNILFFWFWFLSCILHFPKYLYYAISGAFITVDIIRKWVSIAFFYIFKERINYKQLQKLIGSI